MLKIVTTPNQILNQPTKPVINFDKKLISLIEEMKHTLIAQNNPPGVGLAAPQVGINLAIFIIKPTKKSPIKVFINPRIIKLKSRTVKTKKNEKSEKIKLEGCLSIPKIWGEVNRAEKLFLEYQDINGKIKKEWFKGFEATIIQHEIDHLNGILFTQRVLEQKNNLYQEENKKLIQINP